MSETVISVENLYKEYKLGVISHGTLYHDMQSWWARIRGKEDPNSIISAHHSSDVEEGSFLALNDISFEVKAGDRVGIIGRNGAGKSTLLKILSKITSPTSGEIRIKGRIGSLLEVGTGFHPELTGRENIYLNGAILGMNKQEIKSKIDEIIDFAGIEKHIDTPVKRYSSGMNVRLGFAVAAHLEPEILVVDEVLAVGDIEFQKKAIGKMEDVSKTDGRTILFVSHNMGAIRKLCTKGLLLENGTKTAENNMDNVIEKYLLNNNKNKTFFTPIHIKEIDVVVTKISLNGENDGKIFPFRPLKIDIEIDAQRDIDNIGIQIMLSNDQTEGQIFSSSTKQTKGMDFIIKKGVNYFTCYIDSFNLCSGKYNLGFAIDIPFVKFYFLDLDLFSFDVDEVLPDGGLLPTLPCYGHVYLDHKWSVNGN